MSEPAKDSGTGWRPLAMLVAAGLGIVLTNLWIETGKPTKAQVRDILNQPRKGAAPEKEALSRGRAALDRGDLDAAVSSLTEAIRLNPRCAEAHHLRGIAHGRKGDQVRALLDQEEAVRLDPALAKRADR